MNGTIAFDTLKASKQLQDAGVPQAQAEAIASIQQAAIEDMASARELATKTDLLRLEKQIAEQMAALKLDIIKSTFQMLVGFAAVICAVFGIAVAILK